MVTNQQGEKISEDMYLQYQLRAKEFVEKKKEEKQQKLQALIDIFKKENAEKLFETKSTILRNKDIETWETAKTDFAYYKLNLHYLRKLGVKLEQIDTSYEESKDAMKIEYAEYYLCKESECIIFVKYHFKQVVLLSPERRTQLNTLVFVNSKSDILAYDDFWGKKLLKQFDTNMKVSDVDEVLRNKQFEALPANEREYELITGKKQEVLERRKIKDIHFIPKQLLDILLKQYKDDIIPRDSELKIETKFLGKTPMPVKVETKMLIHHHLLGRIERREILEKYEILLYFSKIPEEKVIARIYLTETERNETLTLTQDDLENATLKEFEGKIRKSNHFEFLYQMYFVNQCPETHVKAFYVQTDIARAIEKHIIVKRNTYEHPLLKDTFQKIYIESFEVQLEKMSEEYSIKPIRKQKILWRNGNLCQSAMYTVIYQNEIYLVEVYSDYVSYQYGGKLTIYLPAVGLSEIVVAVFKPSDENQVEEFVNDRIDLDTKAEEDSIYLPSNKDWKEIFPNFKIVVNETEHKYEIEQVEEDKIYQHLLSCITYLKSTTTRFSIKGPFMWGEDDEEQERVRIPIFSNGILYAYYLEDKKNLKIINTAFEKKNSFVVADDLLQVKFENCIDKTMFYQVVAKNNFRHQSYHTIREDSFVGCEIWKMCVNFLLDK